MRCPTASTGSTSRVRAVRKSRLAPHELSDKAARGIISRDRTEQPKVCWRFRPIPYSIVVTGSATPPHGRTFEGGTFMNKLLPALVVTLFVSLGIEHLFVPIASAQQHAAHAAGQRDDGAREAELLRAAAASPEFARLPSNLEGVRAPVRAYAVRNSAMAAGVGSTEPDPPAGEVSAETLREVYRTCQAAADRPTSLADLTAGYRLFQSRYNESLAVNLGVIGAGDVTGNRRALVFKYHFFRIARRNCRVRNVDIPVVWGVGVASTLHIKEVRGQAKTNSLPGIAASVEFSRAEVTMRLDAEGLVGQPIELAFPSAASFVNFDVEAYGTWAVALDKIRGLMSASGVTATPQILITDEALPAIRVAYPRRR